MFKTILVFCVLLCLMACGTTSEVEEWELWGVWEVVDVDELQDSLTISFITNPLTVGIRIKSVEFYYLFRHDNTFSISSVIQAIYVPDNSSIEMTYVFNGIYSFGDNTVTLLYEELVQDATVEGLDVLPSTAAPISQEPSTFSVSRSNIDDCSIRVNANIGLEKRDCIPE